MLQQKPKNSLNFTHQKKYLFELSQTISNCSNCSTVIITDKSGKTISTIKPKKCKIHKEESLPTFLYKSEANKIYNFSNDKLYNKIRSNFVKLMKSNCKKLNLNLKTFFSALDYFDRICSIFVSFDLKSLKQISDLCIILSAKLNENMSKAMEVKYALDGSSNKNYVKDELYLLQILKAKRLGICLIGWVCMLKAAILCLLHASATLCAQEEKKYIKFLKKHLQF